MHRGSQVWHSVTAPSRCSGQNGAHCGRALQHGTDDTLCMIVPSWTTFTGAFHTETGNLRHNAIKVKCRRRVLHFLRQGRRGAGAPV